MERWIGKVAIVTGASSGIGEAISKLLVENGMIVVGLARRENNLLELEKELKEKKGTFYYIKVDLCSEENILDAFKWVKNNLKSIDVVVNNAGLWKTTDLLGNTSDWKQMYDTNVMALNICNREAINVMQEMNIQGHIININSTLGHYLAHGKDDISVYTSTKFSVTTLTESLRGLLCRKKLPIRVTSISPGLVDTKMIEHIGREKLNECLFLESIDIADAVLYALSVPHRVNICEIIIRPTLENLEPFIK